MAYLVGALLALAVGRLGTVVGLDRDRAFYPTIMIVIAFYYILFAVIGGSGDALLIEAAVAAVFLAAALVGFKYSLLARRSRPGSTWHPRCVSWPAHRQSRGAGMVAGVLLGVRRGGSWVPRIPPTAHVRKTADGCGNN